MTQPVVIEGVQITNPTQVWHELKNSRLHFGKDGETWLSGGWYEANMEAGGTMCLGNMLKFVTHGRKKKPENMSTAAMDQAEHLVAVLIAKNEIRAQAAREAVEESKIATRLKMAEEGADTDTIVGFNDSKEQSTKGFKAISDVLEQAAELVKPYAFTHSVTIAAEVMSLDEKRQIQDDVYEDSFGTTMTEWFSPKNTQAREKMEGEFKNWLDGFEERGWGTFWSELADCDTPECEKARKELLGIE